MERTWHRPLRAYQRCITPSILPIITIHITLSLSRFPLFDVRQAFTYYFFSHMHTTSYTSACNVFSVVFRFCQNEVLVGLHFAANFSLPVFTHSPTTSAPCSLSWLGLWLTVERAIRFASNTLAPMLGCLHIQTTRYIYVFGYTPHILLA